jgi:hypothetical protein
MLIKRAAENPSVSDSALRVYIAVVTAFDRTCDAPTLTKTLPQFTEAAVSRLLGRLASANLLRQNGTRTVSKDPVTGKRTRCRVYTLVGEVA